MLLVGCVCCLWFEGGERFDANDDVDDATKSDSVNPSFGRDDVVARVTS